MDIKRVAVVDDDAEILDLIEQILKEEGLDTGCFHQAEELLDTLTNYDAIICDLMLPGMSGLDLLEMLNNRRLDIPFILITGYVSLESAISAINRGAFYYIKKPFNIEEIRFVLNRLRQRQDLLEEVLLLKKELADIKKSIEVEQPEVKPLMPPAKPAAGMRTYGMYDMQKVFDAIEHLGRLKESGHLSEEEFGEYKGKLLKRII